MLKFGQIFKTSKREALARALDSANLFSLAKSIGGPKLTVFNFHRIREAPEAPALFDEGLFTLNVEEFRKELTVMKQFADPISEGDLLAHVRTGAPLPKQAFLVTFDDGYRDNYTLAIPILKELNIPSIFFIPTEQIDERHLGWWDIIHWCLKQTKKSTITVRGIDYRIAAPLSSLGSVFTALMKDDRVDTHTLLEEIRTACDVALPPKDLCDKELMTWEQIQDCANHNVAIGSHTHTHRVLACIDVKTQREELTKSKQILETRLGRVIHSFAYPVGGYEHFNTETTELVRECGYELGFSFLTGVNTPEDFNAMDVKRVDRQLDAAIYRGVMSMPWLFGKRTCALSQPHPNSQNSL